MPGSRSGNASVAGFMPDLLAVPFLICAAVACIATGPTGGAARHIDAGGAVGARPAVAAITTGAASASSAGGATAGGDGACRAARPGVASGTAVTAGAPCCAGHAQRQRRGSGVARGGDHHRRMTAVD